MSARRSGIPRVSVVMATYNGERFLAAQLESLFSQTKLPVEIIICDDGSTDNTLEIAKCYGDLGSIPMRIYRNPSRLGYRENFLSAAKLAEGEFIAFCDQDDIWRDDKLAQCEQFMRNPSVMMIVHQAELIDEQGKNLGLFTQEIVKTILRPPLSYSPWHTFWGFSQVFRSSVLGIVESGNRFVDYIDPSFLVSHDRWISFLTQLVGHTAEIATPLVKYRQHSSNLFGVRGAQTPVRIQSRSLGHEAAARRMLAIAEDLPEDLIFRYPSFNKRRAEAMLQQALSQAEHRRMLHHTPAGRRSFRLLAAGLLQGAYVRAESRRPDQRAFVRDLIYAVRGS